MIAGSGSFRLGRGSVEISRGWFHLPHRSETSIWVWPLDQSALQAMGTAGRSTSNTVMSFSPWARERNDCFSPRLDCWSLNRDPLRQRSPAPRELFPGTAFTHLQHGA